MCFQLKKPLTIKEQIELIQSRGMEVPDTEVAAHMLSTCGYYRISGYMFQMKDHTKPNYYVQGSNFNTILQIYEFDMELRHILLCAIDQIEIHCRARISYHFPLFFGSYGHYEESSFDSVEDRDQFVSTLNKEIEKHQHFPCVKHHIEKYSDLSTTPPTYYMPLWAAMEILSMGELSRFYKSIKPHTIKADIAKSLNSTVEMLENWLHVVSTIRNMCAHHDRIYNRELRPAVKYDIQTKKQFSKERLPTTLIFGCIPMILQMLPDQLSRKVFLNALRAIVLEYSGVIDLKCIGFPANWENHFNQWFQIYQISCDR